MFANIIDQYKYIGKLRPLVPPESNSLPASKAVVAGPAGRRAPDHFLAEYAFLCPFFSFRLLLLFTLILFNLPKFIAAIINNTCCACHQ